MLNKKRILVINDEQDILFQVKRWLKTAGYFVKITKTAIHGIELLRTGYFDLILLDFNLEKEKIGSKTAKTFIPLFKIINPLIPIIIMSSSNPNLNHKDLKVSGIFAIRSSLWKDLPAKIKQVLDKH